jgi:hypothetical protein
MTTFQQRCSDLGTWIGDVLTIRPEGAASHTEASKAKDGIGVFTALLAFVGAQGGALTLADQFGVPIWEAFFIFLVLSVIDIWLIAKLLRLRHETTYYFDRASVLYGKLILYLAIFSAVGFGYAYLKNALTPQKPPFPLKEIAMTTPEVLTEYSNKDTSHGSNQSQADALNLSELAGAISDGMQPDKTKGNVFVSTSTTSFEDDYGDFQVDLFPEVEDPQAGCLAFLCSSSPTRDSTVQYSFRQLNFVGSKTGSGFLTRTLEIRAPKKRDFVVIIFKSKETGTMPKHNYVLPKIASL